MSHDTMSAHNRRPPVRLILPRLINGAEETESGSVKFAPYTAHVGPRQRAEENLHACCRVRILESRAHAKPTWEGWRSWDMEGISAVRRRSIRP
jgi:hypothetical protein